MARVITIEGLDGSGKQTLTENLEARFADVGCSVATCGFPRYGETRASAGCAKYLNGGFGAIDEVSPWFSGMLFALDRAESRDHLLGLIADHDVVVLDRYVASNLVYQAARLPPEKRRRLIDALVEVEFDIVRLPKPDLQILIKGSADSSQSLLARNAARSYTDRTLDVHEQDEGFLATCATIYDSLAESAVVAPWEVISLLDDAGAIRPPGAIADEAWDRLVDRGFV